MKNLVSTWLEIELEYNKKILADVLREMNKTLKSKHTNSRIREWERAENGRGTRMPRPVRLHMLKKVLPHTLRCFLDSYTAEPSNLDKIADEIARRLQ